MGTMHETMTTSMLKPARAFLAALAALLFAANGRAADKPAPGAERLTVFAGAASQPALKEAARRFMEETGIQVDCNFGGSGTVLNQIRMEHFGDLYIPGSGDYMDKAEEEKIVDAGTRRVICRLLPVICVAKGNPKQIRELPDLARPGLRVAIGDPKSVCLGSIAKAALEKAGVYEQVRQRIVTFASDCQQVASLIRMDEVDAAIGYDVFQRQSPDDLDTVPLVGVADVTVPVGVVAFSKQKESAQRFADYLAGPKGREVFVRHGYTVDKP